MGDAVLFSVFMNNASIIGNTFLTGGDRDAAALGTFYRNDRALGAKGGPGTVGAGPDLPAQEQWQSGCFPFRNPEPD